MHWPIPTWNQTKPRSKLIITTTIGQLIPPSKGIPFKSGYCFSYHINLPGYAYHFTRLFYKNNQPDNSNGLPVILVATLFLLLLKKRAHSHETIKQTISLKMQPLHLITKLIGPFIAAKLNFTSGWYGIAELTLAPKKIAMPIPWFTQAKDIKIW